MMRFMRWLFVAAALTLSVGTPAAAQQAILSEIPSSFPSGTGGITAANLRQVFTDVFNAVNVGIPGGRLTLTSGTCVMTTSVAAGATLYYAPCIGNTVPINNGTNVQNYQFTASATDTVGQSIALGSSWSTSTLYDVFIGLNSGTVTLCTGPAWSSSTAGSSSRGTGAGTTQLALYGGMQTNAVSMTCRYSNSATLTCAVNECTYLGSILTSATSGQINFSFGSAAAGGGAAFASIWNMYNRTPGAFLVTDTTATFSVTTINVYQPLDGSTNNRITFLTGIGDDLIEASESIAIETVTANVGGYAALGLNSTSSGWSSCVNAVSIQQTVSNYIPAVAPCKGYPVIGLNYLQGLQFAGSTTGISYSTGGGGTEGIQAMWWW